MSWAPGDLALCVTTEAWSNLIDDTVSPGPGCGAVVEVAKVTTFRDLLMLSFVEWPNDYFDAEAFRKIDPLTALQQHEFETWEAIDHAYARRRVRERAK